MNGRKAKAIRRQAMQEMIDWYKGLLGPEEADKVSKDNILNLYLNKHTTERLVRLSCQPFLTSGLLKQ